MEKGFDDLLTWKGEHNLKILWPQANFGSIKRYNKRFVSGKGNEIIAGSEILWTDVKADLPFGDAWQFLFPLITAGEYADEFDNPAALKAFLAGAENAVKAGQALIIFFP